MKRAKLLGLSSNGFHGLSYIEWGEMQSPHIVVCVHGLTRNARDFDVLAHALQDRCRVVCPDVVGRGQSGWLQDEAGYGFPQYLADATALLARITAHAPADAVIDWVGTSMGGLIGMLLAAQPGCPLRRLVLNDVGPFVPRQSLERIGAYVGKAPRFGSMAEAERYIRTVSASFGPLTDDQWRHLTVHSVRQEADGRWVLIYDPAIAAGFAPPIADVDFWSAWDRIRLPTLTIRGRQSDLLLGTTAEEMTRRGPRSALIEFDGVGHAPALMAVDQVQAVCDFLLS